jgi:protocatechuate 4,5-dioxygenase alpha chain
LSRYQVDKVLWDVYRDKAIADAFARDPAVVLGHRDLTGEERTALAERDLRGLAVAGAHPFLIYNFALRLAGRFSIPFVLGYVQQLHGLDIGDITT